MTTNPFIFIRGLRHVDYGVFCVSDGQKTYRDPIFDRYVPYSSGQQVKRSIMTSITDNLGVQPSPVTFVFEGKELSEKEVLSKCDPAYPDQLLGGWMQAKSNNKSKKRKKEEEEETEDKDVIKRRSPLSISAMHPLHSLLVETLRENISFDRSDRPGAHIVKVRDKDGNELSEEEIAEYLDGTARTLLRKWIPANKNKRASGLFVYDVAIDLRTLFCVSTNQAVKELDKATISTLKNKGWTESENVFAPCLVMPKEERDRLIPALADALLNWRITSNQARTFSLMETLAVAISDNANTLAAAIRAKLIDDGEKPKAKPIVDANAGADLYVTLPCAGYMVTETESATAIEDAKAKLIEMMNAFDFDNQVASSKEPSLF